jgi:predicted TPR repeat methyltransferase
MSDKNQRTEHETALAAQKFLETVGQAMIDNEIPPRFVVNLFGFFARRVVETEVEEGADEAHMVHQVFDAFAEGLGLKTVVAKLEGEAAEQFKAQIEQHNSDTPLQ